MTATNRGTALGGAGGAAGGSPSSSASGNSAGAVAAAGSGSDLPVLPGLVSTSATQVNFGALELGTATRYDWLITSLSAQPIYGVSLGDPGIIGLRVDNGCGAQINPGQSCPIAVTFTPATLGSYGFVLRLNSPGGELARLSVNTEVQTRLSVTKAGGGRIVSFPAGIDCGDTCSAAFSVPVVDLQCTADPDSFFSGLDGVDCAGDQCLVELDGPKQVSARFSPIVNNLVFVSSVEYPPTLGGVAAYDAECNRLATAAGKNTPTGDGFIAAMSDSTGSFLDRLRPGVRGWVRLDGRPFADAPDDLRGGVVYDPIFFDETGTSQNWRSFTGTHADGSLGENCSDWTDPSGSVITGYATGGPGEWVDSAPNLSCTQPLNIFCFGNTKTVPLARETTTGKRIWRTSTAYVPGSMSPDSKCMQERPAGVAVARALVAYDSHAASELLDPASKYVRVDGQLVGSGQQLINSANDSNWTATPYEVIQTGIWQTADGSYANDDLYLAWNGANDMLTPGALDTTCNNWTTTTGSAYAGIFLQVQSQFWARGGQDDCTQAAVLYCFEP